MSDPVNQVDEALLVLRCQCGDSTAFTQLVQRYARRVHYYLRKMLGSADRADDALQDVWVDVFRSIGKLRDASAFASWLYRIARDRAFRTVRAAKPRAADIDVVEIADEIETEEFTAEDAARVHDALDKLAPEHREVLLLRYIESMTYLQIAAITQAELGTVRSRIHYAKRTLREMIERNHHEQRIRIKAG